MNVASYLSFFGDESSPISNVVDNVGITKHSPETLLQQSKEKIIQLKEAHKDDLLIEELIRCTALSRIIFGDCHWCLARSYIELAEDYLEVKQYPEQANQHAQYARKIMLNASLHTVHHAKDKPDVLQVLVRIYHIIGKSQNMLKKYSEAEKNLLKAYKCAQEYSKLNSEEQLLDVRIQISLGRCYLQQNKLDAADNQMKQAFHIITERCGSDSTQLIPVYIEQAKIEQRRGEKSKAVVILKQAYSITSTSCNESQVHAEVCHLLATAAYTSNGNSSEGETYFQESLRVYKSLFGSKHLLVLTVQDDIIKLMVRTNQYKKATNLLHSSLLKKIEVFGECSPEVISSYKLLGSICLVQDKLNEALKYLKECLFLERISYGLYHKRCKMTEHAVQVILKNGQMSVKTSVSSRF